VSPRAIIGTGRRFPAAHAADSGPGPGAYTVAAAKGPSFTIRSRETFGSQTYTSAFDAPGPGSYTRLTTHQTAKRNPPVVSMRPRRELRVAAMLTPAPSDHQRPHSASEKSLLSTQRNIQNVPFGTAPRFPPAKNMSATGEIGPMEYEAERGFKQVSTIKRGPAFSMTFRRPDPMEKRAGHVQPDFHSTLGGMGKQPLSTSKTLPAFTMSGRTKFGSVYM
jgi:hypothetical protein